MGITLSVSVCLELAYFVLGLPGFEDGSTLWDKDGGLRARGSAGLSGVLHYLRGI